MATQCYEQRSKRIGRATYYKLWKDDNHGVAIDGMRISIDERLQYIHENPVRNGLVANAWEYLYSWSFPKKHQFFFYNIL